MTTQTAQAPLLLRVSAVNFATTVFDTPKLSVIRGGSLLAQRLVLRCAEEIQRRHGWTLEPISTGSSTGLFRVRQGPATPAELEDAVRGWLSGEAQGRYLTFAVGVAAMAPGESDFRAVLEGLVARARWEQMQSCRLPFAGASGKQSCAYDKLRPATKTVHTAEGPVALSASTAARLEAGRDERKTFYQRETSLGNLPEFCDHLEDLSGDPTRDNLNGKMAVLYADGNQLGKKESALASPKEMQAFDQALALIRRKFLTELCSRLSDDRSGRWHTAEGKARLEVLFWGGDDFYMIVPAWCGWEALSCFYRMAEGASFAGEPLTFAAGLVFCHHQAPVQGILSLAERLAGLAKAAGAGNHFAYHALESFDFVEKDVEESVLKSLKAKGHPDRAVLRGADMPALAAKAGQLRTTDFPRSQLHRVVESVLSPGAGPQGRDLREKGEQAITARSGDVPRLFTGSEGRPLLGDFAAGTGWVHLANLWDYLAACDGGAV